MDVIRVKDYPRSKYTVYWEIGINDKTNGWTARLYNWDTHQVVAMQQGAAPDMGTARQASQTWVKSQLSNYARPAPGAA
jgi:hypothetical protein